MSTMEKYLPVRTEDLKVGYRDKTILVLMDMVFRKGKFVSLLGPNGVGKTTLLRTMARLLPPKEGTVYIGEIPIDEFSQKSLARILSVVLTERVSPGFFSVFEFVALGRYPHTGLLGKLTGTDMEAVHAALDKVHALDLAERQFETLSDGERQKVLLARALAQEPKIILLDEPTLHLDLKHRMDLMSILKDLCREKEITVLASLHDVDIAAKISDQVVLLKDGKVMDWGPPGDVLDEGAVETLYEFHDVTFSPVLGGIELTCSNGEKPVFVVGGMATSALLYRALARHGCRIFTGVLHENDVDWFVAQSLRAVTVSCPPVEGIGSGRMRKALALLDQVELVIDSGFPVCTWNMANVEILNESLKRGKKVLSLRDPSGARRFFNRGYDSITFCDNREGLLSLI